MADLATALFFIAFLMLPCLAAHRVSRHAIYTDDTAQTPPTRHVKA